MMLKCCPLTAESNVRMSTVTVSVPSRDHHVIVTSITVTLRYLRRATLKTLGSVICYQLRDQNKAVYGVTVFMLPRSAGAKNVDYANKWKRRRSHANKSTLN